MTNDLKSAHASVPNDWLDEKGEGSCAKVTRDQFEQWGKCREIYSRWHGFRLITRYTGQFDKRGCEELAFELRHKRTLLVRDRGAYGSPMHASDADQGLASILSFMAEPNFGRENYGEGCLLESHCEALDWWRLERFGDL
jgi:hypothetical protein